MANPVVQRDVWNGKPTQLDDLFVMRKGDLQATCEVWTHAFGWECRLFAGEMEMIATKVCRSPQSVQAFGQTWTEALKLKGWD